MNTTTEPWLPTRTGLIWVKTQNDGFDLIYTMIGYEEPDWPQPVSIIRLGKEKKLKPGTLLHRLCQDWLTNKADWQELICHLERGF
jgi:hypothetical protein